MQNQGNTRPYDFSSSGGLGGFRNSNRPKIQPRNLPFVNSNAPQKNNFFEGQQGNTFNSTNENTPAKTLRPSSPLVRGGNYSLNRSNTQGFNSDYRINSRDGQDPNGNSRALAIPGGPQYGTNFPSEKNINSQGGKYGAENILNLSNLNTDLRVRDLEGKFMELKTALERRVIQIIEENPQKIIKHQKFIEEKEMGLWKENLQKHNRNQEELEQFKTNNRRNLDDSSNILLEIRNELENVKYENQNLKRDIETLNVQTKSAFEQNITTLDLRGQQQMDYQDLSSELKLLKEKYQQLENDKRNFYDESMKNYQNMNTDQMKHENNNFSRLREVQETFSKEHKDNKEQFKKQEHLKMDKIMGDNEYNRSLIEGLDRKFKDEIQKRLTGDYDHKVWLERQIMQFRDEVKGDQRDILEKENKFVKEIQETISNLSTIVKNTREQLDANISSTQTLFAENLKNVTKTMEILKDNTFSKMSLLDNNASELNKRMGSTVEAFNEMSANVNENMGKEFNRLNKVTEKYEEIVHKGLKDVNDKVEFAESSNDKWKKEFEEKNHNFFRELTIALKALKKKSQIDKNDISDKIGNLKTQVESTLNANEGMLNRIDEKINQSEDNMEYKLTENNKLLASNFYNDYQKIMDEIAKNTDSLSNELQGSMKNSMAELDNKFHEKMGSENDRLADLILHNKRRLQDEFNEKVKDLEQKTNNELVLGLEAQKQLSDQNSRDLNVFATDMQILKNDLGAGMQGVKDELEGKLMGDIKRTKNEIFEKMRKTKEQINDETEILLLSLKQESETGKNELKNIIENSKDNIRASTEETLKQIEKEAKNNISNFEGQINTRFQSMQDGVDLNKKMLMDRMDEMNEATKSIARAIGLEEAAERAKQDEHIIKLFDRKVENMDKFMTAKIDLECEKLRIETKNKLDENTAKLREVEKNTEDEFKKLKDETDEFKLDLEVKEWSQYLINKTNDEEIAKCFTEIEIWLMKHDLDLNSITERIENTVNEFQTKLKKEKDLRIKSDNKIQNQLDEHIENYDEYKELVEDTFKELIDDVNSRFYANSLFASVIEQKILDCIKAVKSSSGDIGDELSALERKLQKCQKELTAHKKDYKNVVIKDHTDQQADLKITCEDMDEAYQEFEEKTNKNFKISEQALVQINNYVTSIDSRITVEELLAKASSNDLHQQVGIQQEETNLKIQQEEDDRIQGDEELEERVISELIPEEINKIRKELNDAKKGQEGDLGKFKKITEDTLKQHDTDLKQHDTDLVKINERLEGHDEDVKYLEGWCEILEKEDKYMVENCDKIQDEINSMNAQIVSNYVLIEGKVDMIMNNMESATEQLQQNIETEGKRIDNDIESLWPLIVAADIAESNIEEIFEKIAEIEGEVGITKTLGNEKEKQQEEEGKLKDQEYTELKERLDKAEEDIKEAVDTRIVDLEGKLEAVEPRVVDLETFKGDYELEKQNENERIAQEQDEGTYVDNERIKKLEDDIGEINVKLQDKESAEQTQKDEGTIIDNERIGRIETDIVDIKAGLQEKEDAEKEKEEEELAQKQDGKGVDNERIEEIENKIEEIEQKLADKSEHVQDETKKESEKEAINKGIDDSDFENMKVQVDELVEGNKNLTEQLAELREEMDQVKENLEKSKTKGGDGTEEDINAEKSGTKSKVDKEAVEDLQTKFEDLEQKVTDLEADIQLQKDDNDKSKEKTEKEEGDENTEEKNQVRQDLDDLRQEFDELRDKVEELGPQSKGDKTEKTEKEAEGDESKIDKEQFDEMKDQVNDLEAKLGDPADVDEEGESLSEKVGKILDRLIELEEKANVSKGDKTDKTENEDADKSGELEELKQQIEDMKTDLETAQADIDELKEKGEKTKTEGEDADDSKFDKEDYEEVKTRLQDIEEKVEELQNAADKTKTVKDSGEEGDTSKVAKGDFDDLKEQFDELKDKVDELDQNKKTKDEGDGEEGGGDTSEIKVQIEDALERIGSLEEQIEDMKNDIEEVKNKTEGEKTEGDKSGAEDQKGRLDELEEWQENLKEKDQDAAIDKIDEVETQIEDLKQRIDDLENAN